MWAILSTVYTRNQDGTCTKQCTVSVDYFERYEDALACLGDERVTRVYPHEIEELTIEELH